MNMLSTIQEIKTKNLTWVNVTKVGKKEMDWLEKKYHFHSLHLADCISPLQRPKLDTTPDYIFMVLLFPIYKRKTRKIISSEIDFFITSNLLVTVHHNELAPLINFFNLCQISKSQQKKYLIGNPAFLIYELISRLFLYCNPILDNLDLNVSNIEDNIFRGYERRMVREILIVKSNIINFKRIMQVHRSVISKLIAKCDLFFSANQLNIYFKEILDTTSDIQSRLENLSQTIDSIEQTNKSLISFRLNDIMKILALISITMLPVTLISSLFSMSLTYTPSITKQPNGWYIITGSMAIIIFLMIFLFKKKRWI